MGGQQLKLKLSTDFSQFLLLSSQTGIIYICSIILVGQGWGATPSGPLPLRWGVLHASGLLDYQPAIPDTSHRNSSRVTQTYQWRQRGGGITVVYFHIVQQCPRVHFRQDPCVSKGTTAFTTNSTATSYRECLLIKAFQVFNFLEVYPGVIRQRLIE